jgi:transcriptional regulator with XRE-family HTH domain
MASELFAPRLRELRDRAGLTQKQLAERSGLSQNAVSQWESGIREPSWGAILALADALGVDCRAFQEPPASTPAPKRGRPRKAEDGAGTPKRPRRRKAP